MAVDGSEVEFVPGQDMLCMLFWQGDAKTADANDISGGSADTNMQSATLQAQQKYFRVLMDACQDNPEIKFMQVDTTKPKNLEAFLNDLPDYSSESIPTVIAAAPNSNAQQFVGWDAKKPFMVIIDKTGKVKYAGPAVGFMPAFILTESTGVEIDLEEQDQPAMSDQTDSPMFEEETTKPALTPIRGFRPLQPGEPKEPVADPNSPMADPNEIVSDPNGITTVQPNKQIKKPKFPKGPPKPAAMLKGLAWIKGKPVKFQTGKIYVVEFWATWCPPCRKSTPHLTEIQRKYKDKGVTIIGISSEKEVNTVKKFVSKQGDKMDYTVAVDKTGKASRAYMQAYKQRGIPCAFVVDGEGLVVWYGNPLGGSLEGVLEWLVSKTPEPEESVEKDAPDEPAEPEEFETRPEKPEKKEPAEAPELPLEDQIRAEKLLQEGKLHINGSRKIRGKNPGPGIEACREVLKEFPNTEYAQQARELLRRVPSRLKERHGITDEEQGI